MRKQSRDASLYRLQNVDIFLLEIHPGSFAHGVNLLVLGVVVRDLHQGLPYHNVVVLVRAHEAGYDDLAGQYALVGQDGGLGTEHQGAILTLGQLGNAHNGNAVAFHGDTARIPGLVGELASQEVGFADEVGDKLAGGMIFYFKLCIQFCKN